MPNPFREIVTEETHKSRHFIKWWRNIRSNLDIDIPIPSSPVGEKVSRQRFVPKTHPFRRKSNLVWQNVEEFVQDTDQLDRQAF